MSHDAEVTLTTTDGKKTTLRFFGPEWFDFWAHVPGEGPRKASVAVEWSNDKDGRLVAEVQDRRDAVSLEGSDEDLRDKRLSAALEQALVALGRVTDAVQAGGLVLVEVADYQQHLVGLREAHQRLPERVQEELRHQGHRLPVYDAEHTPNVAEVALTSYVAYVLFPEAEAWSKVEAERLHVAWRAESIGVRFTEPGSERTNLRSVPVVTLEAAADFKHQFQQHPGASLPRDDGAVPPDMEHGRGRR